MPRPARVGRLRHRLGLRLPAEGTTDAAVHRRKPIGRQYRKPDRVQEAKLLALPCSSPPAGKVRWTLKMLADRLVELKVVGALSDETVRGVPKKTS